jgi:hypothetical protein
MLHILVTDHGLNLSLEFAKISYLLIDIYSHASNKKISFKNACTMLLVGSASISSEYAFVHLMMAMHAYSS